MSMPIEPPFAIKASYQDSQMATGTYFQGGSQVFSHLVSPPASGVAAEEASDEAAQAAGFVEFSAANEVQVITVVGSPTGGSFKLAWGADVTDPIAYNASAATIQTQLNALAPAPAGVGGTNEVQTVTITGTPTGGTFTLTYSGQTTGNINWNGAASDVQTALVALSNLDVGDVTVTGGPGPGAAFTVTFGGTLAKADIAQMTATGSLTGGSTPAVAVTTATPGVLPTKSITVSGSGGGPWTVTFATTLAATDVASISVTDEALTGGTDPHIDIATTVRGRGAFLNNPKANSYQHRDFVVDFSDSASGNHF